MKSKPFCPVGYEPVNDWIYKEAGRRGHSVDRHKMPNDVYCDTFDDLANYLGNYDSDEAGLAVCNVNGRIKPVPVEKWRQEAARRLAEISTGYIEFYHGLMIPTTLAKVFVRAALRLPKEPGGVDGVAFRLEHDQGDASVTSPAARDKRDHRKSPRSPYMRFVPEYIRATGAPGGGNKERWVNFQKWLASNDSVAYASCKADLRSTQFERAVKDAREAKGR